MSLAGRFGWRWYAGVAAVAVGVAPVGVTTKAPQPQPIASSAAATLRISSAAIAISGNVAFLNVDVPVLGAHLAAFVDLTPPPDGVKIPNSPGVAESLQDPIAVPGLTAGVHRITVVLADANHRRVGDASDSVTVAVAGPTLVARATPTAIEGNPWTIRITVAGVRLVKPDGDTSLRTGHLEFVIDGTLPALGAPVSINAENVVHTEQAVVPLTGLEAGEHLVWIVLSDGTHRPFDPYVADVVRVTITR